MARYKPYNPNQTRLMPITLSEHIYESSLEEAIHQIFEEQIDLNGWAVACSPILGTTITLSRLGNRGYISLLSYYLEVTYD